MSPLQTEQVERNYIKEKKAAVKEFDDKKVELKENLIAELEEKKKMIENEKVTMELTGGRIPGLSGGLSLSELDRLPTRSRRRREGGVGGGRSRVRPLPLPSPRLLACL